MLAAARPEGEEGGLGVDVTVRKAVDAAEPKIAEAFKDQPIVEAEVRDTLGDTYLTWAMTAPAIRQFERAVELCQARLGPDHPDTLTSRNNLAVAYAGAGRTPTPSRCYEATLKLRESKLGPDHPDTLTSRNNLAAAYVPPAARPTPSRCTRRTSSSGVEARPRPPRHAQQPQQPRQGLPSRRPHGRGHQDARGDAQAARVEARPRPPRHAQQPQQPRRGLPCRRPASPRRSRCTRRRSGCGSRSSAPTTPTRSSAATTSPWPTAGPAACRGDRDARGDVEAQEAKLGPGHPDTLVSRGNLATSYESLGRWAEAEPLCARQPGPPPPARRPADSLSASDLADLGGNLLKQGKWSEAEPLLRECLAIREKVLPDDWPRFHAMSLLGGALWARAGTPRPSPDRRGYEGMKAREARIPRQRRPRLAEAAERVVRLYEAWGKPEQAAAWKTKLGLADLPADVFAPP